MAEKLEKLEKLMKIYKIAQFVRNKAIIHYSKRLINNTTRENAEYIVRVYESNSHFHVVAYNGKIGNYPVERYKGEFQDYMHARDMAEEIIRKKQSRGYVLDDSDNYKGLYLRSDLPGIPYERERENVKIPQEKEKLVSEPIVPKIEEYDLDAIEDIQAKSNNWYKTSQENYYTSRIARDPNTSSEILKKILEQGNNDYVSWNAARNPNCPASALEMVLKRGNDDYVSRNAAKNPNCPAQALEMVLKRGKDDWVSNNAAYNPNCPALAKIKWMQLTGRIGQFDPSKHIMESDEKEYKEDPDLQKLRALIK